MRNARHECTPIIVRISKVNAIVTLVESMGN